MKKIKMKTDNQDNTQHVENKNHVGRHLMADMWRCQKLVDDVKALEKVMLNACHVANATVLDVSSHKFEPQGVTVMILLAESHISLHSWPEHNYVAIDVFTCGREMDPKGAIDYIKDALKPKKTQITKVFRGEDYEKYS